MITIIIITIYIRLSFTYSDMFKLDSINESASGSLILNHILNDLESSPRKTERIIDNKNKKS